MMMRCVLLVLLSWSICSLHGQHIEKQALSLMGTDFEITVVDEDREKALVAIEMAIVEIRRIEALISSWDPDSQTSLVNRNAGLNPVVVDQELYSLVQRSLRISDLTDGAFDVSFAGIENVWTFDGKPGKMPSAERVRKSVENIGYQKIVLDPAKSSIFLTEQGMKISFGAIGKGYAADRTKTLLEEHGIEAGIINASGDLATWGRMPNGEPWTVAITNPLNPGAAFGILPILEGAVVTSGNYEKFTLIEGKRYAHIIDPRSGYPTSGLVSATVFAPSAELADALATSIFVMGIETGLDRIDQMAGIECLIIDDAGKIHKSKNIEFETIE